MGRRRRTRCDPGRGRSAGGVPARGRRGRRGSGHARPGAAHVDRTSVDYVTLDPATATDLDQAFAAEQAGDDIVLHYAIADVGFFVDPGSVLDRPAWSAAARCTCLTARCRCTPGAVGGAASLLPDGPRPAVVFTVRIDDAGESRLDGAERAVSAAGPSWPTRTSTCPHVASRLRRAGPANRRRRRSSRQRRGSSSRSRCSS